MWTLNNWRAKRRAVTCCDFSGKSNCMAVDHVTGKYWIVCFRPQGFLALPEFHDPSSPPWGTLGCSTPKQPLFPPTPPAPCNTNIWHQACRLLLSFAVSPLLPAYPCQVFSAHLQKTLPREGAVIPLGGGSGAKGPGGALAPRGEVCSMLLQLIKETGQVFFHGSGVVLARRSIWVCFLLQ